MKHSYRITKYNPAKRDKNGAYLDTKEWTSISDNKTLATYKEYLLVENAYINAVLELCEYLKIETLSIHGLEQHSDYRPYSEGQKVGVLGIDVLIRKILREELWCRLKSDKCEFHFGYDYYMYLVSDNNPKGCFDQLSDLLYVEEFKSPYLETA